MGETVGPPVELRIGDGPALEDQGDGVRSPLGLVLEQLVDTAMDGMAQCWVARAAARSKVGTSRGSKAWMNLRVIPR